MYTLLKNPTTKQIAVKSHGNEKFEAAVRGMDEAVWSEKDEMWILPESCLDQVEFYKDKYVHTSAPKKKEVPAELAKIIPMKAGEPEPEQKPEPDLEPASEPVATPEPAPEPVSEPEKESKQETKPDASSDQKQADEELPPFQSSLLTAPIIPWRDKLGDLYRKAKAEGNQEFVDLLIALGNMAKKDETLQAAIEQPQKTFDRAFKYVRDKVMETYLPKEKRKGEQCVAVSAQKVMSWVLEYIAEDDYQKVVDEEKAEYERKLKAAAKKKELAEKEKKRKEREAKKKAKEEKEKQKQAASPVPVEIPALAQAEKPEEASGDTPVVPEPEPSPVLVPDPEVDTEAKADDVFDDQMSLL